MGENQQRSSKVLVVAREAATRSFVKRTLESVLLEADAASRLDRTLEALRAGVYAVLVLDPVLPRVDGIDLLRDLYRADPSLARRTVLIVERDSTLASAPALFSDCRRIDRPVLRQELIRAVSECLRESGTS
jgi:DNA-binding NtrC family response regulator